MTLPDDKRTLSYPYLGDPAKPHTSPHSNTMRELRSRFHGRILNEADTLTVPSTPEEMAEFISDGANFLALSEADDETRKAFFQNYNREVNKSGAVSKQVGEQVSAELVKMLKEHGVTDLPSKSDLDDLAAKFKGSGAELSAQYNPYAPGAAADRIPFNGVGDVGRLIMSRHLDGYSPSEEDTKLYDELKKITAAYSSNDPASAGFLIPEEQRSAIMQLALEQSVVRGRATTITMSSKTLDVPFVDVTTHSGSLFGGMIFYWTEESAEILSTEAKFGRVRFEANKLTGGARIPNELISDASALTSWLNVAMPSGIAHYEDQAFLTGDGAGQPLGVTNSPAVISITRDTGSQVNSADIFNMYARMLPQSLNSAVWVINQTVLPQLLGLTIDVGTGGSHIGLVQQIPGSPVMQMLGRPIVVTEKIAALGSANDIMFVDFGYYLLGDRQAVSMDTSGHSRFMNDEMELRIIERVDGRPWVQSALTPVAGDTLSPYIGLAA